MQRALSLLALAGLLLTAGPAAGWSTAGPSSLPADLPDGMPQAVVADEVPLPPPAGWPFPEAFPRTSGTGRLEGGAAYWTDFLLDDTGAAGLPSRPQLSQLARTTGTYAYPDGPAVGNGADVFRAAVGLTAGRTVWRVDWRTLVDPAVPAAVWALDLDGDRATGSATWPGVPGLTAPGTDAALVVTASRATLLRGDSTRDLTAGLRVDRRARSFVLAVPRSVLPVEGASVVRLAAGLATSTGLAPVPASRGALPGQPPVYDLGIVRAQDEPQDADWRDGAQARALADGNGDLPGLRVDWAALADRRATAEPRPTGSSDRWYVAGLDTGEGAGPPPAGDATGPVYRGRVQPYAVHVPTRAPRSGRYPLTLLLHSTGTGYRQYAAGSPNLLGDLCESRRSICVTPLGYGPAGNYLRAAEVDTWRVWRAAAEAYPLDRERTVVAGYSMGGYGAYRLGFSYPHLFAQALVLAGQPDCGPRVVRELPGQDAGAGVCTTDGDTTALAGNARELPLVIGQGALDQRIPATNFAQHLAAIDAAGVSYTAEVRPAEDHLGYALKDEFGSLVRRLDGRRLVRDPGTVDYALRPALVDHRLGVGPTGAYWVSAVRARPAAPGSVARVVAVSEARAEAPLRTSRTVGTTAEAPSPGTVISASRVAGPVPARRARLRVTLTGVAEAWVDAARAGFRPGEAVELVATADGPARVVLSRLRPGTVVRAGGRTVRADPAGTAVVRV